MASIKYNLPENGKLGFRLPESDPQFNWRNNPNIASCRKFVTDSIQAYLAQNASMKFAPEIHALAACLENQLFKDALSKNDYMDQEKLLDRVENLINLSWNSATTSLPIYASAPTLGMKSNFSQNFNKSLLDQYTSADAGYKLDRAPNLLADVPRSSIYGSQKCFLDTNSWQPELVPPNNHFSGVGFSNTESGDSGITYSGNGLQYDSEASFKSHRYKYQNSAKGKANFDIFSDLNSPSVHTSAMARENLKFEVSTVSDGLYMRQPVLGPLQFKQQLSRLESHSDGCFGEIKSLGSLPVQNGNLYASPGTTSTSSNTQQRSTVLLYCYIIYNNLSREGHEVPFLEYLHSLKCTGGICKCEERKWFLSHFDDCGSADCNICGSAVRICSAKGINIIQPGLRKQRIGDDRLTRGNDCGKRVCVNTSEDLMNPAKSRKLDSSPRRDSPCDVSVLTEEPFSPSGPLNFEQLSVSPMMATIANPGENVEITTSHTNDALRISESDNSHLDDVLGCESGKVTIPSEGLSADVRQKDERVTSHIDDATRLSQEGNGTLKDTRGSNSDDATNFSDDLSADFCQKEIEPAVSELKDKVPDSRCELPSDYVPNLCDDKSIAQNVEFIPGRDPEEIQPRLNQEGFPPIAGSWTGMKSEKQKVDGISLIDFFTPEEIKRHMSGLRQKDDQGIIKELVGNGASCSVSENFCQLCALAQLAFSPMPLYCSSCGGRIKKNVTYYSTNDKTCDPFCFCTTCYNKCPRGNFSLYGLSFSKSNLKMLKNDSVTVESWVLCDRCEGWQHQICALFNDKKDLGGKSEYLCPRCYLEDLEFGGHAPLPRSSCLDASNLPQTLLSDHLEKRLFRSLKEERENRVKAAGKKPEEVPHPADLAVRVVSSVDKRVKVKQQFLDIFPEKSYPAEFPYRSKVILLFQRIEGVDVCLFAIYVQEFGSSCSQPNQRCVYISYLDSVKYFRPDTKTVKGEALRTFVYHEILVGYLDYCKKRGFATCYIWACPPVKGEDYILYCHPETQKTPRPDKLRQWYQSMLKKATEEKIVVNFSNLYEKFFAPTEKCNTKVTSARLPYFDGDYWSSVVESMIKKIDKKSGGDPQKQVNGMTKRRLKAMGHINPSADDAKDILLMQELEQSISSAKEDFIIVYLQFVCTHCHEIILSGQRWFCNQCKNYQLCGRCHDVAEQSGPGDTHMSSGGQRHALSQEVLNDVPVDTEDNDAIMDNCFLENRHALLSFCQGNHYQFDSLRRAKHSSMMILYHLHYPSGSNAGTSCGLCLKDIGADPRWMCEICPEFSVCSSCYEKRGAFSHNHTLIHHPPTAIGETEVKTDELVKQLLDVLLHASRCQTTMNQPCSYPNCLILRRLFSHAHACNIRVAGGCRHCKKAWFILLKHSQRCKDSSCGIPRCMDLKNHAKRLELKSASRCLPSISVIS